MLNLLKHSGHSDRYLMPILKAAKKALRQNKKRRLLNLRRLWAMHKIIKKIEKSVGSITKEELQKLLSSAQKAIDKAAKRGIVKKNTAARKKSRLAKIVNRASLSGDTEPTKNKKVAQGATP